MRRITFSLLLIVLLAGCGLPGAVAPPPLSTQTVPAATLVPTASPSVSWTPSSAPPTASPTSSSTPDPYQDYTIDYLRSRTYGGGQLEVTDTLGDNGRFMRYLVRYPSDGLMIHGFMDVPKGDGPFPVVIALHGYIDPAVYNTFDYTTRYADALANAGFLVIHPNLRGYSPSDDGDNLFRVGMAEDVLNLLALVKSQGGQPGPLEKADSARLGLWGHSMGGGIVTRVLTVSPDVKAAVLYGPMSGDDRKNYEAISSWSGGTRVLPELSTPDQAFARISPEAYFDDISAAVSINHGRSDATVPLEWSMHTCELLRGLGKDVECNYYDGAGHTFTGQADEQFMYNMTHFFDTYLVP